MLRLRFLDDTGVIHEIFPKGSRGVSGDTDRGIIRRLCEDEQRSEHSKVEELEILADTSPKT